LFLSGDVHHSYLADARLDADVDLGPGTRARLLQAVCSPIRNPLPRWARWSSAASIHMLAGPMGLLASRTTHVADPPFRWSITDGPWFNNAIAALEIDGRRADLRWDTADVDGAGGYRLRPLHTVRVS
jgi:hypothetical protein